MRRLPHAGVAAHDGGDHLPERHGGWEVAGVDDAADTEWTAVGEQLFVREFRIDGLAVQAPTFGLEEKTGVDGFLDFATRFLERLANLTGFKRHQRILVLHQESTHVADDLTTGGRRRGGPCGERSACSVEGFTNVVSGGEWKFTETVGQMSRVG